MESGYKQGWKIVGRAAAAIILIAILIVACIKANPLVWLEMIEEVAGHRTEDYAVHCGKGQGYFTRQDGKYYYVEIHQLTDDEEAN